MLPAEVEMFEEQPREFRENIHLFPVTCERLEESYAYNVYKNVYPNKTEYHSPDYGAVDEYSASGRPSLANPGYQNV
jgi:hypothetical protein